MIRPTPLWRSAAVLGVAGLVLTACGGSSDTASTSDSPSGSASAPAGAKGDGTLTIGTLLPQTGSLAYLGPPEIAGVGLAVKDINDAGGVNGKQVVKVEADSGDTTTDTASQSVDRLLSNNVDVIVGAASSSVSLSVIDKITGAGVLEISPANTSDELTNYADKGLYFRTAPPDVLQGRVLGDLILSDGNANVAILARQDSYGTGLAAQAKKAIEDGGGKVVTTVVYAPDAASFATEVGKIKAAGAEAIALISFDETKKIIPEMVKQGIGPSAKKIYFVDGNLADYSKDFAKGTLTGVKGTQPGVVTSADFQARMKTVDPKLTVYNYGPESYDATIVSALAAVAAKDDAGASIAAKMQEVSGGGTVCTSFKDCVALLKAGKDIDYNGVSGPIDFNAKGDPSKASIGIYSYGDGNTSTFVEAKNGQI
jgi:ABC-type branched-subunit amino acid transport system substrate-binding protein